MLGELDALGRSIFTACVSSGAVMMKITSNTSMTSISGIMLISAIGVPAPVLLNSPNAMSGRPFYQRCRFYRRYRRNVFDVRTGGKEGEQVMRERIELGE